MSYRFKSGEALAGGLKRIFHEEIQSALKETERSAGKRGEAVHEFRKHLKKLRAALRLVSDEVGKARYKREDRCVREIAKVVSDLRDAHVRLQTVIQLREKFGAKAFGRVFQRIEDLLALEADSFSAATAGWEKQVVRKLKALEKRLAKWRLQDIGWKQICGAVTDTYRRGRDLLAEALKKPKQNLAESLTDDPLHEDQHSIRRRLFPASTGLPTRVASTTETAASSAASWSRFPGRRPSCYWRCKDNRGTRACKLRSNTWVSRR